MAEAIDFTKVTSKKYRLWRILQSPASWASIYRDRGSRFSQFKSAIIFPEQLLGLNQERIWMVTTSSATNEVSVTIRALRSYELRIGREPIKTVQELFDFEHELGKATDKQDLKVGDKPFVTLALFSNLSDATKYGEKEQKKLLSKYC